MEVILKADVKGLGKKGEKEKRSRLRTATQGIFFFRKILR